MDTYNTEESMVYWLGDLQRRKIIPAPQQLPEPSHTLVIQVQDLCHQMCW